ncbi:hypothetical protein BH10PSE7_BH10PSE7_05310 [soil metagenome]
MRRALLIAVAVAGFIIAAAVTALIVKVGGITLALQDQVTAHTGAPMRYSGLPGISFWPTRISYGSASIPLPNGMVGEDLVRADRVTITLANSLLSFSKPAISDVTLSGAALNFMLDEQNRASWALPPLGAPLGWRLENGTLNYHDRISGQAFTLSDINAAAVPGDASDGFGTQGRFVWNGRPVDFTLFVRAPKRIAEDGSPVDVTFTAPGVRFEFSGQARSGKNGGLSGQASAAADDLGHAARWLGLAFPDGPGLDHFTIAGAFAASAGRAAFQSARFTIGASKGQGSLAYARPGGRPRIDVTAGADKLDFNAFLGKSARTSPLTVPWPEMDMNVAALRDFDATLALAVNAITYENIATGPARLQAKLEDGILAMDFSKVSFYGGEAGLHLKLDGSGDTAALQVGFDGTNIDGEAALQSWLGFGGLAGTLSTSFTVASMGNTEADLVSNLKGSASARFVDGHVAGHDFGAGIRDVTTAILSGWSAIRGNDTIFDGLSAAFAIEDGIADVQSLTLNGPLLQLSAKGNIDLLRQSIDLKAEPHVATEANSGQFVSLPVAVAAKGPWIAPRFYPDMPGILENPKSSFEALKKLGAGAMQ